MDTITKDFTAVIPFREISLPPLGSLASNILLFNLTVIAILLVPVSRESTISLYSLFRLPAPVHHDVRSCAY